jgi:hypothetical protein
MICQQSDREKDPTGMPVNVGRMIFRRVEKCSLITLIDFAFA